MLIVRHKAPECIGCDVCVELAPTYWQLDDDGLARLRAVERVEGDFTYAVGFEDDRAMLSEAADECPVDIIRLEG